jgi:peptide/nickel transport system substrate-binding protein
LASRYNCPILSKDVLENKDPNSVWVGTGPFQVVEYKPNNVMFFKRFPQYWMKGLPYLDEIEVRLIKDSSSRVAALRSGSVDYTWFEEVQPAMGFMNKKGYKTATAPSINRVELYINTTLSTPPLNNVKVRQALSSATDRKEHIRVVLMGMGALTTDIPPGAGDFAADYEKLPFYDYNPERAKKLLAEAGYPNGFKLKCKVSEKHVIHQMSAQILQRQWKKIGVDLEIIRLDWANYSPTANKRHFEVIYHPGSWRPDPDGYVYWGRDKDTRCGLVDPKYKKLVEDSITTVDHAKRVAIYHEMQRYGAETVPMIYLFAKPGRFEFWKDYVKGYVPQASAGRTYFRQTWLDK